MISKVSYIAELNSIPDSAYTIHVLKMCDNFKKLGCYLKLYLPYSAYNNSNKIKKKYLLKNYFLIENVLKKKINNFFDRARFGYLCARAIKRDTLIITRSFWASFFLILMKKRHYLEFHANLLGMSKFLFIYLNFIHSKYIIKKIFNSKSLKKEFKINNKNSLVLSNGVDLDNSSKSKISRIKILKNFYYIGGFYEGRGINLIINLAKEFPNVNFILIGSKNLSNDNKFYSKPKNVKIKKYCQYNKIPSLLKKADVLLMPYEKKVNVNSKNLNTANYCSPIKMFEYLAAGKIILSSNLPGISEVLKDNFNCFLSKGHDLKDWIILINKIFALNSKQIYSVQKNSLRTAKKFTWLLRCQKILNDQRLAL
jgi:glycosyltransferase involved in cell wall biosynthesis